MPKVLQKKKIKTWPIIVTSGVIGLFIGFAVSNFIHITQPPRQTSNSSVVAFTIPQIPLPSNWETQEKLPGNSFDNAFPLNPGIKTQGTLNGDNVLDFYTFSLSGSSDVILNVTNVPKALYLVLYDQNKNQIASTYRTGAVQGSTQVNLQYAGKYYIKVWADCHTVTNYPYTIRLSIMPDFE
jgi:hypothetical protein